VNDKIKEKEEAEQLEKQNQEIDEYNKKLEIKQA
jgi:hypothetical protein